MNLLLPGVPVKSWSEGQTCCVEFSVNSGRRIGNHGFMPDSRSSGFSGGTCARQPCLL